MNDAGTHCLNNVMLGVVTGDLKPLEITPNETFKINGKIEIPPNTGTRNSEISTSSCYGFAGTYAAHTTTEDSPITRESNVLIGLNFENPDNGAQFTDLFEFKVK